jgi:hypothetical protein
MSHPPLACRIRFYLAIFLCVGNVAALAQSPASQTAVKKTSPTLEVVSAEYFPRGTDSAAGTDASALADLNGRADTVRYKLRNNDAQRAVTAYQIEISFTSDGKPVGTPSGLGMDLMNLVMNAQCHSPGSSSEPAWQGAIKPGGTYADSTTANVDKEKLKGQTPTAHVAVVGIIWSDGAVAVEGEGWPRTSMNRMLNQRRKDADAGAKVIAILDAHHNDPDIHHRIAEVAKAIQVLTDEAPGLQKNSERTGQNAGASAALSEFLSNLHIFESTAYPKEAFEAYSANYECRYKLLASLLGPASVQAAN